MDKKRTELSKFYARTPDDRLDIVSEMTGLDSENRSALRAGLDMGMANSLVENAIGVFALPLGVATNFRINGRDLLIPMVTEEPSVIAAASAGAKAAKDIMARGSQPHVTGQIQIMNPDSDAGGMIRVREDDIMNRARDAISDRMDVIGVLSKSLDSDMMVVEITINTGEAMGANAVNTMCEHVAPLIEEITGGRALLRILSNHMRRVGSAEAFFDIDSQVAKNTVNAYRFARLDKARAVTHNKGIMNGMIAVGLATGQDTRALEASAHAYASDAGFETTYGPDDRVETTYGPLSKWEIRDGRLWGEIDVPLAVGTVGGLTKHHPAAVACLKMLGNPTAQELAGIMAAVGLCQNFSALRALATDGIQKGHMRLHRRRQATASLEPKSTAARRNSPMPSEARTSS